MHEIHWYHIVGTLLFLYVVIRFATWLTLAWFAWASYHAWLAGATSETYIGYGVIALLIISFAANIRGGDFSMTAGDDADAKRIQDEYHRRQRESYFR